MTTKKPHTPQLIERKVIEPLSRGYTPLTPEMRAKIKQLAELTNYTYVGDLLGATNGKTRVARRTIDGVQARIRTHFYRKVEDALRNKLKQIEMEKEMME